MDEDKLAAIGLEPEAAQKIRELFAENEAERTRLLELAKNAELEQNQLKESVTSYQAQLSQLKKAAGDNAELKERIATLEAENQAKAEQYQRSLHAQRTQAAVRMALLSRERKPHDAEIVTSLLDLSALEIDEKGRIKGGLDKQLQALEEKRPFLFSDAQKTPVGAKPFAPNPSQPEPEKPQPRSIGKDLAMRETEARRRIKDHK